VPTGAPVPGAPYHRTRVTDARGVARFTGIPEGPAMVLDAAPPEDRFDLRPVRLATWAPSDDPVTLGVGLVVRGVVSDRDGRPVAGASVIVTAVDVPHASVESRSDGRFTVGGLLEGEVRLHAVKSGDVGGESPTVVARAGTDGVVLRLDAGLDLVVRIEGWPADLVYEWVTLTSSAGEDAEKWARVLSDGTVTFRGCPSEATYGLVVRVEGPPPRVGALDGLRPGAAPARLTLGPGRSVTGTLQAPPGAAHLAVRVQGRGLWAQGTVDAEGKFVVPGLPAGTWTVHASADVGGRPHQARAEAAAGTSVDLVLEPAPAGAPSDATCGAGKCG
jgi:hypothetical protein